MILFVLYHWYTFAFYSVYVGVTGSGPCLRNSCKFFLALRCMTKRKTLGSWKRVPDSHACPHNPGGPNPGTTKHLGPVAPFPTSRPRLHPGLVVFEVSTPPQSPSKSTPKQTPWGSIGTRSLGSPQLGSLLRLSLRHINRAADTEGPCDLR